MGRRAQTGDAEGLAFEVREAPHLACQFWLSQHDYARKAIEQHNHRQWNHVGGLFLDGVVVEAAHQVDTVRDERFQRARTTLKAHNLGAEAGCSKCPSCLARMSGR